MDSHTRVSYQRNAGFLERIGHSLVGILVGLVFLVVASGLLFWNEGRAVQTAKSLDEGLRMVVHIDNPDVVSQENSGKLVHLSGELRTDKSLTDPTYGVTVRAVKLVRKVEMYQWVESVSETKYNEGAETRTEKTYSYDTTWREDLIRSQSFDSPYRHENPTSKEVNSVTHEADDVYVGGLSLSKVLISKVNNFKQVDLSNIPPRYGHQIFNGAIYTSQDPLHPKVGDLRITFQYAGISGFSDLGKATVVSIVARQLGSTLRGYETYSGDELEMLYIGQLSAVEIFGREQAQNAFLTWAIRFGGWLMMFVGFSCLTSLLTTLVDWIPLVRDVVALGVGLMNASLSISLSLTVIALGWIRYRPLLGMTILVLGLTPFILSRLRGRSNRTSPRSWRD